MNNARSRVLVVHAAASSLEPAYSYLLQALGSIPSVLFDPRNSAKHQLAGVEIVVDIGGWSQSEFIRVAHAAGVKFWQVIGYGLDHLDLMELRDAHIIVARTPGPTTAIPLAEHAMYLLLAVEKNGNTARALMKSGHFYNSLNGELAGRTLAIIGFGASGQELAKRARGFGIRVLALDLVDFDPAFLSLLGVEKCFGIDKLHEVLAEADYVSLHLPLTDETRQIIDGPALAAMKPGGILINVARGGLTNEEAVIDALKTGLLRGAGLDVFEVEPLMPDHPYMSMPNVVLTPHLAAATLETFGRRSEIAAENVRRSLAGERMLYIVP